MISFDRDIKTINLLRFQVLLLDFQQKQILNVFLKFQYRLSSNAVVSSLLEKEKENEIKKCHEKQTQVFVENWMSFPWADVLGKYLWNSSLHFHASIRFPNQPFFVCFTSNFANTK